MPQNWAFCNGALLSISQNQSLFSLLGATFGGNAVTTFALPDLRGRVPVGVGSGAGLSTRTWGQRAGVENVTLSTNELPAHNHTPTVTTQAVSGNGNSTSPVGNLWATSLEEDASYSDATPDATMKSDATEVSIANTGGGQSHENMPPFLGLSFIICLDGIFPTSS